jgi:hypothetical protein
VTDAAVLHGHACELLAAERRGDEVEERTGVVRNHPWGDVGVALGRCAAHVLLLRLLALRQQK